LEIRILEGKPTLIAGERRLRSILALIQENDLCFNRITRKMEHASQLYSKVCCIETDCESENAAAIAAVVENTLHVPLNDFEVLLNCQLLDDAGMSRQQQAESLGMSEAWISQTFSLLNPEKCHPKVLESMADGVLGRTQALQLLNYPAEKVEDILKLAVDRWKKQETAKEQAVIEEQAKLLKDWDDYDGKLQLAIESGNAEAQAEAAAKLNEAEENLAAADKNIKKVKGKKGTKPKPSMEQIQQAAMELDAEGTAQRHMPMKTLRQYADKLTTMLEDKEAELFNPNTDEPISRKEVRLIRDVCDCILARNKLKSPIEALFVVDEVEEPLAVAAK
jgi:hypothetical protein